MNGGSAALDNDEFSKSRGARELAVGAKRECPVRTVHRARRNVHVPVAQRSLDLIHADLSSSELRRVQMDADSVFLRALDLHLSDARHCRDALRQRRLGVLIQDPWRNGTRHERQKQNRLVGGIRFTKSRRARHTGGKKRRRLGDCRLNVKRRAIEFAAQVELQCDLSASDRIRR